MLKQGIKNYFKSLKYFFTPLGTMFLGMMIGFSVLIPTVFGAVKELAAGINTLSENVNLDFHELFNRLWAMVTELSWETDVENAFRTLFSTQWLNDALTEALSTILGSDFETFKAAITTLCNDFLAAIASGIFVFFAFWVQGFIVGYVITKFLIRRTIAKRSLWKKILFAFINSILTTAFLFVCAYLSMLWNAGIPLVIVMAIIFVSFFSLLEAYLMYGVKKLKFKSVVNAKNIGLYILTNLIIFAISVCFSLIAIAINKIMGLFVGLSLAVITILVVSMNSESYLKSLAENAIAAITEESETPEEPTSAEQAKPTEETADKAPTAVENEPTEESEEVIVKSE